MTEPSITENPDEWLAGQSTTPPQNRADQILRDMYPHGRRDDKPAPVEQPDWQMSFQHGDLQRQDIDEILAHANGESFEEFQVTHHAPPPPGAVDLIVKTPAPNYLQDTLNQMPMVQCEVLTHDWNEDTQEAIIRCYNGCEGFVRYALNKQGYAQVIGPTQ